MSIAPPPPPLAREEQDARAFPTLSPDELAAVTPLGTPADFADGDVVFRAGQPRLDLFVVESGALDILNPADDHRLIVTHTPGHFSGDIDILTGRPAIVTAVARGATRLCRVPGRCVRELLARAPSVGEKLLVAFQTRRQLLSDVGQFGLRVVGPGTCRDTTVVREFLYKNFVPFTWYDTTSDRGRALLAAWGNPRKTPVIETTGGQHLINPTLPELARAAGIWEECPTGVVDLAVVGAGPAGITAAVYAASEGLSTLVLDRLGPGGQAGLSSKIENFIGFPAGLSGAELASRGVLQMLKFGAHMVAPVTVRDLLPAPTPRDCHTLHLDCGAAIPARTVLVASGVAWRKLTVPGADRFERQGVYYACTQVEATLHDKQDVAVVGAGNSAGQAVMFLAECCRTRTVHHLVRRKLGPGMSDYLSGRIRAAKNVVVHEGVEVAQINGTRRVESVELQTFDPNASPDAPHQEKPRETLPVGAVFVFIGADPGATWLPDTVARDRLGYILTGVDAVHSGRWPLPDREPCPLETTLPGVLAAGDVRAGSTKRVGFAVGDGSLAVTCAHRLTSIRG